MGAKGILYMGDKDEEAAISKTLEAMQNQMKCEHKRHVLCTEETLPRLVGEGCRGKDYPMCIPA
jgi:hypothetical protein